MGIPYLTSEIIPVRHGFFGRAGGVSKGIYKGLNCGQGSDDSTDTVKANRGLVADAMSILPANLLSLHQIHSADVLEITNHDWPAQRPKADALVTAIPDIGLGIVTADCAPVLFSDPDANIIGAAHAGWKGAVNNITGATIDAMLDLGAKRRNIRAAIGPCISQQAYEVGQEFFEIFADESPDYAQFFANGVAGKYQFDLPMFVITQLNTLGIHSAEWVNKCTYANESEYFSYRRTTRRNEPDYGRQISVITNSVD